LGPTPEDLADRFMAAFDRAAEAAESENERSRLHRLAALLKDSGRALLVDVTAAALTRRIGRGG
jgi:hypothetical protein